MGCIDGILLFMLPTLHFSIASESHPGKVIERRWYERNKHIFPASRWQLYDPAEEYGKYTIRGGELNAKK
jgi:XAP5, circadian clock regulator